jgi:hypothetical protein
VTMKLTRKPPAKKKTAKKKTAKAKPPAKPPVADPPAKPPVADPPAGSPGGDDGVLGAVGADDGPELNLAEDLDAAAAERIGGKPPAKKKTAKNKTARPRKDSPGIEVSPEAQAILDPGLSSMFLTIVNNRLAENLPRWAATEKELADFCQCSERLAEKWFPDDVSEWGPEALFLACVVGYVAPRVMAIVSERQAAAKAESEAEGAPDSKGGGVVADPPADPAPAEPVGARDPRLEETPSHD